MIEGFEVRFFFMVEISLKFWMRGTSYRLVAFQDFSNDKVS